MASCCHNSAKLKNVVKLYIYKTKYHFAVRNEISM